MTKIRILIVDDSALIRGTVREALETDDQLEVIGQAANGLIALKKLEQSLPDIVILDVEMPELDGLSTLTEIRKKFSKLPVIMFSALTERGAIATIEALSRGASDYFAKPSSGSLEESKGIIINQLIPAIKELARRNMASAVKAVSGPAIKPVSIAQQAAHPAQPSAQAAHPAQPSACPATPPSRVDAVCIAVSTGGPNALEVLFQALPAKLPVPFFIVQHMPATFTRILAERLSTLSQIPIAEAKEGMIVEPGKGYLAPGDYHMTVSRKGIDYQLNLNQKPLENSCRPAADPLFRSAVNVYKSHLLAVVLTGMGQDGLRGCEAVKAAGGQVIVQDEPSSVVWGMPGSVFKAGLADRCLPMNSVAYEIIRRLTNLR